MLLFKPLPSDISKFGWSDSVLANQSFRPPVSQSASLTDAHSVNYSISQPASRLVRPLVNQSDSQLVSQTVCQSVSLYFNQSVVEIVLNSDLVRYSINYSESLSVNQSSTHSVNQSVSQSLPHSAGKSISQSVSRVGKCCESVNPSANQSYSQLKYSNLNGKKAVSRPLDHLQQQSLKYSHNRCFCDKSTFNPRNYNIFSFISNLVIINPQR